MPRSPRITNQNYEVALSLFRLARTCESFPVLFSLFDGGLHQPDAADPCPVSMPDQFVPGPTFGALCSDTDCDGTVEYVHKITARNLAEAREIADREHSGECYDVVTLGAIPFPPDTENWSEREYFMESGYARIAEHWNRWVYDDTIGIPALDHTYDD